MYKAIVSFAGKATATAGDIIEHLEDDIAKDLLKAGYIVKADAEKKKAKADEKPVEETKPVEEPVETEVAEDTAKKSK